MGSLDMRQISHHEDSARSALLCSESNQPGEVGLLPARDLQCEGSSVRAPPAPGSKARILLANWILRSPTSIQAGRWELLHILFQGGRRVDEHRVPCWQHDVWPGE